MINWLAREKVTPMNMAPGDTIRLHYHGVDRSETISAPITQTGVYDTLAIGKLENELGFEEAIVGVIGRAQ